MQFPTRLLCLVLVLITWLAASAGGCVAAEPVKLTLEEAIRLALLPAGQARLELAAEAEKVAEIHVKQTRAATALQVDGGISDRVLRFDLRSIGVDIPQVSPFVSNVQFPAVVGPFTVMDSRVRVTKSVINRAAARQVQAAREEVDSAKTQSKAVAGQITAETVVPLAGGTASGLQVSIPAGAPTGPGSFQVVNRPSFRVSNAVSVIIGAPVTITKVEQVGSTVTVEGTGFSQLTVINLFNLQGNAAPNLGGLTGTGARIPLSIASSTRFTFTVPAAAVTGPAYVEAINPPFAPFSSSGTDPDGSFTIVAP